MCFHCTSCIAYLYFYRKVSIATRFSSLATSQLKIIVHVALICRTNFTHLTSGSQLIVIEIIGSFFKATINGDVLEERNINLLYKGDVMCMLYTACVCPFIRTYL